MRWSTPGARCTSSSRARGAASRRATWSWASRSARGSWSGPAWPRASAWCRAPPSSSTPRAASGRRSPRARAAPPSPRAEEAAMIGKLIDLCAKNRWFVIFAFLVAAFGATAAVRRTPLDAIPDLSDPQVIVFTEWMGRSPTIIEDQVTYPIASSLLAAPKVTDVRGFSMFGMSFVYVLFEEGTDVYWARSRVLEHLSSIGARLPAGVTPTLGPDATAIGWVYEYAVVDRTGKHD